MGCDIHLMVEVKDRKTNQWTEYDVADGAIKFIGRNYNLFGILANVRNGFGFAHIDTGDAFIPISNPRGVPKDASKSYLSFVEDWGTDGHSHSFLNLDELQNFEWEESYYESTAGFVDNVIPALEKIATDCSCTNEEVRIVFFFDN
ncbi:hypothetical protein C2890_14200 [Listeria monocytogenes]|nr:hypothetical protein [Listeria monocytogenes]